MTTPDMLSKAEFWSAPLGALTAFLLGAIATWWTAINIRRTAGNMAIVALSQMCTLAENLRLYYLVQEPIRAKGILHRDPYSFELRPSIGLPAKPPHIVQVAMESNNCNEGTSRNESLLIHYYGGTQTVLPADVFTDSWEPVPPDTLASEEMQYVCSWKAK